MAFLLVPVIDHDMLATNAITETASMCSLALQGAGVNNILQAAFNRDNGSATSESGVSYVG